MPICLLMTKVGLRRGGLVIILITDDAHVYHFSLAIAYIGRVLQYAG